ncbi:hypothetical protein OU994_29770 [Pseudoduganella sp. SL102]|uniref:hypothetical protein n=1 Tax=Pseudoduganella sp. SL102 TaxID=2995154 RepID=UPI00248CCAFF|nr:hypothetical protein [Pseudoduganella sp. SL102]WBS02382.1 hypothetical protein OU994_29770 [Pseudoduganella sp. SL102]
MKAYKPILKSHQNGGHGWDLAELEKFKRLLSLQQLVSQASSLEAIASGYKFDEFALTKAIEASFSNQALCRIEPQFAKKVDILRLNYLSSSYDAILNSAVSKFCHAVKSAPSYAKAHSSEPSYAKAHSLSYSVDPDEERRRQVLKKVRGMLKRDGGEITDGVEYQLRERAEWD